MSEAPLALLGGLSAAEFLTRHWQKAPLLVRQAMPGFRSPLDGDELAGLACEEGIESRLVLERGGTRPWELRHGPFEAADFAALPETHWTLLVQDVDKVVPALADLLERFDFLPRWRIDDLMVSYAAPGGGVGPHLDSYDVFLLQAAGRRRWSIDTGPRSAEEFLPGLDLRILPDFRPAQSWELEPGDMLYLPPGLAHEGVALGECMTFSVGLRAPSQRELLEAWVEEALGRIDPQVRYGDPDIGPASEPGLIDERALARVRALLEQATRETGEVGQWFGRLVTAPAPGHPLWARARPLSASSLLRSLSRGRRLAWHPACRCAYTDTAGLRTLYAAGEAWPLEPPLDALAPLLTRNRRLPLDALGEHLHAHSPLPGLLARLVERGCLELR